jgi:hypothetical protein
MLFRRFVFRFKLIGAALVLSVNGIMIQSASAAGSVAMQAESLMKLAPQAYNMGMRNGDPAKWNQYFESKVRRTAPGIVIDGEAALQAYNQWEFDTFKAKWVTKRITVHDLVGAMEYEWSATHKPSGDKIKIDGVAMFELGMSGKVKNIDFYFDSAGVDKYFQSAPGRK